MRWTRPTSKTSPGSGDSMKIAIYTMYFLPDYGSATILMSEFAGYLARRGHPVSVITTIPRERADFKFAGKLWDARTENGYRVIRIWTNKTPHPLGRLIAWWIYTLIAIWVSLFVEPADLLFMRTPPPTLGVVAAIVRHLRGSKVVLSVQDIHPDLAIESGILTNPIGLRLAQAFEKWVYAQASSIVVISEGFRKNLEEKGVPPKRLTIIPNWVDTQFVKPYPKVNEVSRALGLDSKFVVLYSGTITTSSLESLRRVLAAAALLKDQDEVIFAIVGEGIYRDALQRLAEQMQLPNMIFLPFRPQDEVPFLFAAADIALVPLDSNKAQLSVPSKLYNLMSAGKPILGLARQDTEVAQVINGVQCGLVVDPDAPRAIADAILQLQKSASLREQMGANGRREVERNYNQDVVLRKYEDVIMATRDGVLPEARR